MQKKSIVFQAVATVLMIASFSACNAKVSTSDSNKQTDGNKQGQTPGQGVGAGNTPGAPQTATQDFWKSSPAIEANVTKVAGKWTLGCQPNEQASFQGSVAFGIDNLNRVVYTRDYYGDANCGAEGYKIVLFFNVKDDGTGTDTAFDLLPTLVHAEMTFTHPDYVNWANTNEFCGINDWALNAKRDVTGKTCGDTELKSKDSDRITVSSNPSGTLSIKAPGDELYYDYRK